MKQTGILLLLLWCFCLPTQAQHIEQANSSEIYEKLEKFNFLGSALYVAAHPDDENTRLISYLSNGLNARTAYLSITRGDGGQNLIGTEIREMLGVIRSQELQMARSVDGGSQFFTRANDFGYSKHPDETLEIWNKEKVLEDMVYTIRQFKPDVIVNRFDHNSAGRTHGHHTSSAMLALEAYDLAQDKSAYAHQLESMKTWKVHRHFFNTSWWFYGSRENFAKADKSNLVPVDVGVYYPVLGMSNNEISALARSKHRSQGFGSAGDRGNYQEYLELLRGTMPEDKNNIFEGIDTKWTRIEGGEAIQPIMDRVMAEYDFTDPSAIVNDLLEVNKILTGLEEGHWRNIKLKELNDLIVSCLGLHLEGSTDRREFTQGDSIEIVIEWTNRSQHNVKAQNVVINGKTLSTERDLVAFTTEKMYHNYGISEDQRFTNPYWLDSKGSLGMYSVEDESLRNNPQSPDAIQMVFNILVNDVPVSVYRSVNYRYVNPAVGEIREPLSILPPATISFNKELYLLASENKQEISVSIRATKDSLSGTLSFNLPDNWKIQPETADVFIDYAGSEKIYQFTLESPNEISEEYIQAQIDVNGISYDKSMDYIVYDHIPRQTILSPAESKIVKVPLGIGGRNIAYLMGAGDKLPESLRNVGYNVTDISLDDVQKTDLNRYDAIVIGVRAYNTLSELKLYNNILFDYAYKGGTLITQYNTSRRLNYEVLAPYPLKLSRKRVTDEYAEMRVLKPAHKVLNYPNKINTKDFDSWVQERGLYFPEEWDAQYEAVISCNDKNEDPLDGSLLIAKHGEGYFVYTSLSWFRQLPAGVPGAYRLFANLLALSQEKPVSP